MYLCIGGREFWIDSADRLYELRAPTPREAAVWVGFLKVYAGCRKSGKMQKVTMPPPLVAAQLACLHWLIAHGATTEGIFRTAGPAQEKEALLRDMLVQGACFTQCASVLNVS